MGRPIDENSVIDVVMYECGEWVGLAKEIVQQIITLPTAEPQIIRCKDCKYRILDERYGAMCDLDTGDPYSSGRNAEDDDWFCADAERRQDG